MIFDVVPNMVLAIWIFELFRVWIFDVISRYVSLIVDMDLLI